MQDRYPMWSLLGTPSPHNALDLTYSSIVPVIDFILGEPNSGIPNAWFNFEVLEILSLTG